MPRSSITIHGSTDDYHSSGWVAICWVLELTWLLLRFQLFIRNSNAKVAPDFASYLVHIPIGPAVVVRGPACVCILIICLWLEKLPRLWLVLQLNRALLHTIETVSLAQALMKLKGGLWRVMFNRTNLQSFSRWIVNTALVNGQQPNAEILPDRRHCLGNNVLSP